MKKRWILLGIGFLMACAQGPVELTEKDTGQVVTTCVGQGVQIALKSNATTGFQWHFALDPPTADVKVLKESYVPDDHPGPGMRGFCRKYLRRLYRREGPRKYGSDHARRFGNDGFSTFRLPFRP